jgi:hypothetical protein
MFATPEKVPLAMSLKFLREGFTWKADKDLFALNTDTVYLGWNNGVDGSEYVPTKDLPELAKYIAGGTVVGPDAIRFAGRVERGPADMLADDFRLIPGSAGKGVAASGKVVGADLDLVGPGAAYERWRQTPAYQQWRKDTDAVMD